MRALFSEFLVFQRKKKGWEVQLLEKFSNNLNEWLLNFKRAFQYTNNEAWLKKRALIGTAFSKALSNKKKIFGFISDYSRESLEMRKATLRKKTCVVKLLYR